MSRNPQSNYSFRETAALMGGRYGGQYIVNDTVETYGLPWGGIAVVRILPVRLPPDPANPGAIHWTPFRNSQEVNHVGDWIRCYHGVRNFGADASGNGVSFLISDPSDPTAPPKEESPPYILHSAITRAIANKQERPGWGALLNGGQNKGPQLPKPAPIYMAQVLVMQHKEIVYNPPKGWALDTKPQLMIMSQSAGQTLMNLANAIKIDADPQDTDWTRVCTNGDMVGLGPGQGQYVTFYKSSEGDPRARRAAAAAGQPQGGAQLTNWGTGGNPGGGGGGGGGGFATYQAFAEPTFNNQLADLSHVANQLALRSIQWDQLLNFPSYEQQAAWIADKFEPDVICYAFQDHPDWIPERVMAAYLARTQQAGFMQPQGGYMQPQVGGLVGPYGIPPQSGPMGIPGTHTIPGTGLPHPGVVMPSTTQMPAWGTTAPIAAQPAVHVDQTAQYQQQAASLAQQQAAAQQQMLLAQQQAALQQQQQMAPTGQAAPQVEAPIGAVPFLVDALAPPQVQGVPAAWSNAPQSAAPAHNTTQQSSAIAGIAAGGIPVAVTQATVAASNAAQQPAAGFAMPVTGPAAAGQPAMSRAQMALAAANQAAQVQ